MKGAKKGLKSSTLVGVPNSLDYRDLNAVTSVKNQGSCGSCWAFGTTAQYESILAWKTGQHYDLSEQFVLDCSGGGTCNGGYTTSTLEFIAE
ncbi:UNVERIFIED_CONTAM: hypothetical protein GTU68_039045 [Idotea baltica]|nr:hypothetical protein [Idotea baltica]